MTKSPPSPFTPQELQAILTAARHNRIHTVQRLMEPKQSVDSETLLLHGRVFPLRNDAHVSVLADLCRAVCADVVDWAERRLGVVRCFQCEELVGEVFFRIGPGQHVCEECAFSVRAEDYETSP